MSGKDFQVENILTAKIDHIFTLICFITLLLVDIIYDAIIKNKVLLFVTVK